MRCLLFLSTVSLLFVAGCYTKFATLEQVLPAEETKIVVDSLGDTIRVISRVDTVISKEKETCVWERDFMGRPYLRCYDTYYPRDWFIFNNSPWWYRNDPFWYDYKRCPRFYFYDPSCGCCRNYRDYHARPGIINNQNPGTNGDGHSNYGSSNPSPRTRSDGIPTQSAVPPPSSNGTTSGSLSTDTSINIQQKQNEPSTIKRQRSPGIPEQSTVTPPKTDSETASTNKPAVTPEKIDSLQPIQPKQLDTNAITQPQPRRRNSRSW